MDSAFHAFWVALRGTLLRRTFDLYYMYLTASLQVFIILDLNGMDLVYRSDVACL